MGFHCFHKPPAIFSTAGIQSITPQPCGALHWQNTLAWVLVHAMGQGKIRQIFFLTPHPIAG
jgi:hypothetical protein